MSFNCFNITAVFQHNILFSKYIETNGLLLQADKMVLEAIRGFSAT